MKGKIDAQFQSADACHVIANYHGVTPGPRVAEQEAMKVKAGQVGDSQRFPSDPHSDPHFAAPDLVLRMQLH